MSLKESEKTPSTEGENSLPWYKRSVVIVAMISGLVALIGTLAQVGLPKFSGEVSTSTTFRGRVSDDRGKAIGGAKVILEAKGLPPLIYTDSEGVFAFNLPAEVKTLKIRVEANGFNFYDRRVDIAAKSELEDIRLTPVKVERKVGLSGSVVDRNENGIQGATVSLDGVAGVPSVQTSSKGVFNLEDLPLKIGDRVRLRVVRDGYLPNPYLDDIVIGDYSPTAQLTKVK